MDDGEVELSDHVLLPNPDSSGSLQSSVSVDSLLDEFLNNTRTCTHTHTCNPIGPDAIHTHTCYHTHTQVITSEEDDDLNNRENSNSKAKRPAGNREAVRKYREKKKAHTAYLEEEVKKLRTSNQQLVRKIQQQGDTIAAFKDGSSSQVNIDGNGKLMESWEGNCQPVMENCQANMDNMATTEGHAMEMVEALMSPASRVQ
ncbi:BASIC LEUCINE ZIPPER 23 [Salix purpurea]|uniref:BASIC LEUCINE ZIPPER 23 n=1 Tax=Salix purpurea TaxID=77065 RepID=A0A9Q0TKK4_SALPP|nr:BASIC LEUCINE ZIPPER 23 [Salix purpurea]